jgi:hypothetical protein
MDANASGDGSVRSNVLVADSGGDGDFGLEDEPWLSPEVSEGTAEETKVELTADPKVGDIENAQNGTGPMDLSADKTDENQVNSQIQVKDEPDKERVLDKEQKGTETEELDERTVWLLHFLKDKPPMATRIHLVVCRILYNKDDWPTPAHKDGFEVAPSRSKSKKPRPEGEAKEQTPKAKKPAVPGAKRRSPTQKVPKPKKPKVEGTPENPNPAKPVRKPRTKKPKVEGAAPPARRRKKEKPPTEGGTPLQPVLSNVPLTAAMATYADDNYVSPAYAVAYAAQPVMYAHAGQLQQHEELQSTSLAEGLWNERP